MARVLVIDDEFYIRDLIGEQVRRMGHAVETADTLSQGRALAATGGFDLVFLDVRLPDGDGLSVISELKASPAAPEVVIITGAGNREGAGMAVQSGAWDYLQKPLSLSEITLQIKRSVEFREKMPGGDPTGWDLDRSRIIGHSRAVSACLDQVRYCAAGDGGVLIHGETGTGKELFARTIHENSPRSEGPFVVVDCAALPEPLVESILFGHVKGAFTGAEHSREGLIRQAHRGTLFLDEVGELPPALQRSFLRVLQERRFRPVGGQQERESDFRLISATHRSLESMVAEGLFRKDLLYRVQTTIIHLPGLRQRKEDIKLLMLHYIHKICQSYGTEIKGFVPELLEILESYDWPGNVRELIHALEHAVTSAGGAPTLYPAHLPPELRVRFIRKSVREKQEVHEPEPGRPLGWVFDLMIEELHPFRESREHFLQQFEKAYVTRLMEKTGGDLASAMAISGMSRTKLYGLLKKHGVSRTHKGFHEIDDGPDRAKRPRES